MSRSRSVFLAWLPAGLYMLLIFWLSSRVLDISLNSFPFRDKGIHACEYAMLGALLSHAFSGTFLAWSRMRVWLSAVAVTILFGWSDEIHQAFVPGRDSDIYDLLADSVGAVIGATVRGLIPHRCVPFAPQQEPRT